MVVDQINAIVSEYRTLCAAKNNTLSPPWSKE